MIQDNEEAKEIIKTSDIKAETNQEIYLEAEMDSEVVLDGRKSMYVKPTNIDDTLNNMYSSATDGNLIIDENPFSKNPANEVEEIIKQIEELKRSIQSYESENGKLNTILTNYASNSALFKTKNRGK